jgi:hypothetical protein
MATGCSRGAIAEARTGGGQHARQAVDGGGLAGAVGAQQTKQLAAGDAEPGALERPEQASVFPLPLPAPPPRLQPPAQCIQFCLAKRTCNVTHSLCIQSCPRGGCPQAAWHFAAAVPRVSSPWFTLFMANVAEEPAEARRACLRCARLMQAGAALHGLHTRPQALAAYCIVCTGPI